MDLREAEKTNNSFLNSKVDAIFIKIVKDMLKEKPRDPIPWLIDWFHGERNGLPRNDPGEGKTKKKRHHFLDVLRSGYLVSLNPEQHQEI